MTVQPFPRCGRRQLQDSGSSPDVVHIQTYSKVEEGASFVNAAQHVAVDMGSGMGTVVPPPAGDKRLLF
ncbi:hypothetical protein D9Q98_007839 [Chlorella vulgaris]|uniref:Uncharacterized protein n=1 Tax=Chlorella vulgaris TaxID=3077 RepID=A0A9D4YTX4_CHLVU|nr:hypothetical protein D9Q98_007839 [Chlorella vulgaris]